MDETLRRNTLKSTITTRVNVDRVRSMLRMIYHRRKFKAWLERKRLANLPPSMSKSFSLLFPSSTTNLVPRPAVPEIIVDDDRPSTPPPSSPLGRERDITLASRNSLYLTDTPTIPRLQPLSLSPSPSLESYQPHHHAHRRSDMSALSADLTTFSPTR